MKKIFLLICMMLVLTGCDTLKYNTDNNIEDANELTYLLTKIADVPDGWSESDRNCYYYHVDTKIVYFGADNLSSTAGMYIVELKSDKYVNYIYNENANEFIGIER